MQKLGLKYLENGTPQLFNLGYKEFGINKPVAEGYDKIIFYLTEYDGHYILKLI